MSRYPRARLCLSFECTWTRFFEERGGVGEWVRGLFCAAACWAVVEPVAKRAFV